MSYICSKFGTFLCTPLSIRVRVSWVLRIRVNIVYCLIYSYCNYVVIFLPFTACKPQYLERIINHVSLLFLFEFQTRKAAKHVIMVDWRVQEDNRKLDWWSPTRGAFHESTRFDWVWIRALGLPLNLWNKDVVKKIGDACGGWLENEEETNIKNHLRWVRICVWGPKKNIPTKVELSNGKLIFSLPIWCEASATFKPAMESKRWEQ